VGSHRISRSLAALLLTIAAAAVAASSSCTTLDDVTAPSCAFALSSSSAAFDNRGGSGTVPVRTASSCAWKVTTNDAWVTLTTSSGSGDADVSYTVATNAGTAARTATLSVSGQPFTVSQSGTPKVCTFGAAPTSAVFLPAGGSGTVNVTTDADCSWTATSQVSWITIQSGRNGSGNGVVGYKVDRNNSKNVRSGTMNVAGRTVTISQGGDIK